MFVNTADRYLSAGLLCAFGLPPAREDIGCISKSLQTPVQVQGLFTRLLCGYEQRSWLS